MKKTVNKKISAFILIFVIMFSLCAPQALAEGENNAVSDFKAEVIRLVNAEREKAKIAPLAQLDILFTMADVRAQESTISFGHTRPDGTRCFTIFSDYDLTYKAAGENLASGYKKPEKAVNAWMGSSAHKANILDPDFAYIGIGYFLDSTGRIYCSQLFYTPESESKPVQNDAAQPALAAPVAQSNATQPAPAAPVVQTDVGQSAPAAPAAAAQPAAAAAPKSAPVTQSKGPSAGIKAQLKHNGLTV